MAFEVIDARHLHHIYLIRSAVKTIIQLRLNGDLKEPIAIDQGWPGRYVRRQPELYAARRIIITRNRFDADIDSHTLSDWFNNFWAIWTRDNIIAHNFWNMIEKGFAMGRGAEGQVVVGTHNVNVFVKEPGNRNWASVIECIGARGKDIPPYVIFKGEETSLNWAYSDPKNDAWKWSISDRGWSNSEIGRL